MTPLRRRDAESSDRSGFTLIEVMVALLLTSFVALLAHQLLAGVIDGTAALRRSAPAATDVVFGREWVVEACRSLEVGTPGTHGFEGTPISARFTSRILSSNGWVERGPVAIEAKPREVRLRTEAITAVVADSTESTTLDYLADGGGENGWVTGWSSPVSAPLAIRIRWMKAGVSDSLYCPIGARG